MFYKYKKQIITILVILVLIFDFLLGKSVESNSFKQTASQSKNNVVTAEKNTNYQQQTTINGVGYSAGVTVDKAAIASDGTLNFSVIEDVSTNVIGYDVIAIGANNNVLNIQQTGSDSNSKTTTYSVQYDNTKDTKITLKIYPLTQDMKNNSNLKLDTFAYGETVLNMNLITQDTINAIKGTGGSSSGN